MKFLQLFFMVLALQPVCTELLKAQFDSTNLPLFIIETNGLNIPDEPKIKANLKIIHKKDSYNHTTDEANIYDGVIGIEIRGRYSASLPQKPFGLETRDADGNNLNVSLLGMPQENDWILLANYNDKTFMRNSLTFDLFRKMDHYAPRTHHCEVLVNGNYQGIYVFTEKIKRDKNRVNIATLNPEENSGDDLTGGYIIKVDYYNASDSWRSGFDPGGQPGDKVHFVYEYPKADEITQIQKNYIQNFIREFETVIYSAGYSHEKISKFIDIPSFIDYFILNELARNVDAYKKSSFFYKDKDSKGGLLHAGPVWDFDWAWKNINECYFGATDGSGWAWEVHYCNPWPVPPGWMNRLLRDPIFGRKVNQRYFELRDTHLSEANIYNYIDSVANVLRDPQLRHFAKWQILGKNVGTPEMDAQPATYSGEIEKFKMWISRRLQWLDINIPGFIVTGAPENDFPESVNVYPNPAQDYLTVVSATKIMELMLFSMEGKSLYSDKALNTTQVELDLEKIEKGAFFLTVTLSDGSRFTRKVIKTR